LNILPGKPHGRAVFECAKVFLRLDIPGNLALARVLVFGAVFAFPQTRMVKPKMTGTEFRWVRGPKAWSGRSLCHWLRHWHRFSFDAEKVVGMSGTEFRWGVLEDRMGRHRAMQTKKNPASPKACGVRR